jgi:hypothetical protein
MFGRLRSRTWICCLAAMMALAAGESPSRSQEHGSRSLDLPRGVKLDAPEQLQGEALAEVLENYARQLRAKEPPAPAFTPASLAGQPIRWSSSAKAPSDEKAEPGASEIVAEDLDADTSCPSMHCIWGERRFTFLPATLLWQPPLANPHEPRFFAKTTNLETSEFNKVVDFSIGGTIALWRISPVDRPHDGFQLDLFATRYRGSSTTTPWPPSTIASASRSRSPMDPGPRSSPTSTRAPTSATSSS